MVLLNVLETATPDNVMALKLLGSPVETVFFFRKTLIKAFLRITVYQHLLCSNVDFNVKFQF